MLFQLLWPWIKEPAYCLFPKKSDGICMVCKCLNTVLIPLKCKAVQNRMLFSLRKAFSLTGSKLKSGTTKLVEQSRGPIMTRDLGANINQPGLKNLEWITTLCNSTERRCMPSWLKSTAIKFRQTYSLAPFLLLSITWTNQTSETIGKSCRFQSYPVISGTAKPRMEYPLLHIF